jgi:hypothetical protein
MSYSATMVLPCRSCGAECHIIMECDDDPQDLRSVPIICCMCSAQIGRVPATSVLTHPSARGALTGWLVGQKGVPLLPQTADEVDRTILEQSCHGTGFAVR